MWGTHPIYAMCRELVVTSVADVRVARAKVLLVYFLIRLRSSSSSLLPTRKSNSLNRSTFYSQAP